VRSPLRGGHGEYRLLRQAKGRTGFAHVVVELGPRNGDADVVFAVRSDDEESAIPERDAQWFQAAAEGCREALRLLRAQQVDTDDRQVRVTRLLANLVDTTPDAVHAAAGMATADAFGAIDRFDLRYEEAWRIQPAGRPR
jgi:hypothetical protein